MNDTIRYILSFLLYGDTAAAGQIAYCRPNETYPDCPVVILGEGLNQPLHYPDCATPDVESLPNGHYLIHTDLIYNTFFFISRAEELLNEQRDEHGRFLAAYSVLGEKNRLQIPMIDEYSQLLLKLLNGPLPTPRFSGIHLTHDIDTVACYHHLRGILGGLKRGRWKELFASQKDFHNDPAFTFPWMMAQDQQVAQADVIFFVKDTPGRGLDYPQYPLAHNAALQSVYDEYRMSIGSHVQFGLHSSAYESAPVAYRHDCPMIDYRLHRSHYLSCSLERMRQLVAFGITDDYTMMFPDCAGFRLQTTRPVRWIDPLTRQLTSLTLHPLTVMDCTLSNANYMNLNESEAYFCCQQLIDKVRQHGGEMNLLWHNSVFAEGYHSSLYPKILALI